MSKEVDFSKVPYAKWLEDILPELFEQDVRSIGIVVLNQDDTVGTAYYNSSSLDKGIMAHQIAMDSTWDMITANIDILKEEMEKGEETNDV